MFVRIAIVTALLLIPGKGTNGQDTKKEDAPKKAESKKVQEKDAAKARSKGDDKKLKAPSEEEKAKVIAALSKAQSLLQSDSEQAIKLTNQVLADFPVLRPALFLKANAQHFAAYRMITEDEKPKEGYAIFLECAATMRKLAKHYPKLNPSESQFLGVALYNEACAYSLKGKKEEAIKSLGESIKAGSTDISQIEKDEDLKAIRKMPEYKKLIDDLKKSKKPEKDDFDF